MTLDEAIKHAEEVAEINRKVLETGVPGTDGWTFDDIYCGDTEVIEEHKARVKERETENRQIAAWLKELKAYREAISKIRAELNEANFIYLETSYHEGSLDSRTYRKVAHAYEHSLSIVEKHIPKSEAS